VIVQVLRQFTGSLLQRPPAYSALKVGGVPSYRLARKGQAQEHAARPLTVHSLELLQYADPLIEFRVHCSKGTYVRTLCADIGDRLGCGAHLTALTRERAGRFTLADALSLERLAELVTEGTADGAFVSMNEALDGMPSKDLTSQEITRISHGNPVPSSPVVLGSTAGSPVRLVSERGELIAVGVPRNGLLWPETVLT
jgi:tRNA pseudouridine55 synthase